jgi:mono/diheme cytochrome c family protein
VSAPRRVAVTLLLALLAAGCGGGGKQSPAPPSPAASGSHLAGGSKVFVSAGCGSCHALAAAGSTGTVGPNLDELHPTRARVAQQVRSGGGGMPSFAHRLSERQIQAVADFVSRSAATRGGVAPVGFEPDRRKLSSCTDANPGCYLQAFGNLAYTKGPAYALSVLRRKEETDSGIRTYCHPIAHTIGAGALKRYNGDVGKAFAAGDPTCGSGYYHGLLQCKLAGVARSHVSSVARKVCESGLIRANAFTYYQCVHGLGHGLMLYTRYNLPGALRLCHGLRTSYDQVSCTGGVFMENQQSSYGIKSRWLKSTDLLYPCDIVARRDKLYCYLLVTSHILPDVGWNWKKTADWCRKSDAGFVAYCFQSYGRDASGSTQEQPRRILDLCRRAGSGERECIFGAVRDILNNDASDPAAGRLCELVSGSTRSYCVTGIGTMVGTQYAALAEQRAQCRRFSPSGMAARCLAAARSAQRPQ